MDKKEKARRRRERERRKLRTLQDKIRDAKGVLTDREVFTGLQMREYLIEKVTKVLREQGIRTRISVNVVWQPENTALTAFTDNSTIVINSGHPDYQGDSREETFKLTCGLLAHEVGHVLFTNFSASKTWLENIAENGKINPGIVPAGYEDNADALEDFLQGKRGLTDSSDPVSANRTALTCVVKELYNILEDPREELCFSKYCAKTNRVLDEGLSASIENDRTLCPGLAQLLTKLNSDEAHEFHVMQNMILHYGRFGEIKGYINRVHKNEPVVIAFRTIRDECDDYIESLNAHTGFKALNSIVVKLFPMIEDYIIELDKRRQGMEDLVSMLTAAGSSIAGTTAAPTGTSSGTGSRTFIIANPQAAEATGINGSNSPISSETAEEKAEEGAPEGSEGQTDENSSGKISNDAEAPKGCEEVQDENPEKESEGSSQTDLRTERSRKRPNEKQNVTFGQKGDLQQGNGSGFVDYGTLTETESNAEVAFNSILEGEAGKRVSEQEASEEEAILNELLEEIDFDHIHDGVDASVTRHTVTEKNKLDWDNCFPELYKVAEQIARKSDYFTEDAAPLLVSGKYSGKKFMASRVCRNDGKAFARKMPFAPSPTLSVAVRVDESGSMSGSRIDAAKRAAILIYLYCHILGVKVAIYGDDTYSGVELHAYTDFDTYDDEDDKYRLMNISAGGSNRDGYAIKYVVERLKEQESDMKLMIIISDGQPADTGYYGQPAEADLKHICKEMDHDGIAYIAAAIGDDKETIKAIYGERHFLDISDLTRLPEDLVSLIRRLLR